MIPIWKDTYYTSADDTLVYEIQDDSGNTLFTGKAYKSPDADELHIKVNDICSNYLVQPFPIKESELSGTSIYNDITGEEQGCVKNFNIVVDGLVDETYRFYYDYSYKDVADIEGNLTVPFLISTHSTDGMWALDCVLDNEPGVETYQVEYTNDTSRFHFFGLETGYCGDYAIYYTNRYGAWSSYLVEGSVIERDSYEQNDYTTSIDNSRQLQREKIRFYNEITHSWEIKTGWLSDNAARMLAEHLLSSGDVWLHNLTTNKVIPVVITNAEADYKTFDNERKMFGYVLNLEESNKKVIK